MVDRIIQNDTLLSCCYSFLKRRKLIFGKDKWDRIKQYDEVNARCIYPFNDGVHLDSIIDFDNLKLLPLGEKTCESDPCDENTTSSQTYSLPCLEDIQNMYLFVYPDVIIAKGDSQSIVYDLSEKRLFGVPNSFVDFLCIQEGSTIGQIVNSFLENEKKILFSYVTFLVSNKLARLGTEMGQFGTKEQYLKGYEEKLKISTTIIDSAIIDVTKLSSYNIQNLFNRLNSFRCSKILLRFFESNIDLFFKILSSIQSSNTIVRFDIYLPVEMYLQIANILTNEPKLFNILVYRCPECSVSFIDQDIIDLRKTIYKSTNSSLSPTDCGNITFSRTALIPNNDYILKNHFVNSCLYKKISIDSEGYVKNCPSMKCHFGHIDIVDMQQVIEDISFKKYWYITKDQINTCCTCQYRYSCFDCRAYTENDDLYGRPSKCKFSPSLNTWKQ